MQSPENPAPTQDPPTMIELRKVSKWYGEFQALKEVSLTVRKGERVVICGPSGSGKSTAIRCINRLEQHQQGQILVEGVELTSALKNIELIRREVGMVFQQFNLFPHLTVLQNLTLAPRRVRKMPRKQAEELAMEYLARVHIADQALKYPAACRAGSSSGWRSPAPSAWNRMSCCSTNPPRRSIRR